MMNVTEGDALVRYEAVIIFQKKCFQEDGWWWRMLFIQKQVDLFELVPGQQGYTKK